MKKRVIPKVPTTDSRERRAFDDAVKENLEVMVGQRGGTVSPLPPTASSADVIAKVNEILARLQ